MVQRKTCVLHTATLNKLEFELIVADIDQKFHLLITKS